MKVKSENPEVFYITDSQVKMEKKDFDLVVDLALNSKRHRARLCAHENRDAHLHEMFDVFTRDTYLHPLKQKEKIYSYHVIHGTVDLYLFSEVGAVTDIISLGDFQSGKPFYFRLPVNTYRTLIPISDIFIYREVTTGPFEKKNTIFAPWAPTEDNLDGVKLYISQLKEIKLKFKNKGKGE